MHRVFRPLGDVLEIGGDGPEKVLLLPVGVGVVEDPQAVAAIGQKPCIREHAQVPGDAGLAHLEHLHQFVDGEFVLDQEPEQADSRCIGEGFEKGDGHGGLLGKLFINIA